VIDYPRWGRRGWRRWVPSWKLVTGLFGFGLASLVIAFVAAYASTDIPAEDQSVAAQTTVIYYADGKTEIGRLAEQNRQSVELAAVPMDVQHAVLAAEDDTFYSNSGVSPTSIIRAAWSNARGNALQGGSTITQQYVKNVYDQRDRSVKRKAKEFFIALKINREKTKPEILAGYLNTIYLGRGAYGFEAASQAYFGKSVGKLDVSQAAFIAGVINAPSLADPRGGKDEAARAERRWNVVLDAMVKNGWLEAGKRAGLTFPKTIKPRALSSQAGQRGYLIQMVTAEVGGQLKLTKDQIASGGYKIVTTFDKGMIEDGVRAVKQILPPDAPKRLQIGITAIDPRTGAVRSIYGGKDYLKRQQNAATQDRAEMGSTAKPFGLVAGLEDGISLYSRFSGASPMMIRYQGTAQEVKNFGNTPYGVRNLLSATASSINTIYVQLNAKVGPEKTADVAFRAGIPREGANFQNNLVNVLGSANPHPIDVASAYATFAAQGVYRKPYVVRSVSEIATGKGVWATSGRTAGKRVFDEDVMADATYAMQQVVRQGSGSYARLLGREVAGKTGTSTDSRSAWFVGSTPQLTTSVAMYQLGKKGPAQMQFGSLGSITGGGYPVRIWTTFMQDALQGKPRLTFPRPTFGGDFTGVPIPTRTRPPEPSATSTAPTPSASSSEPEPTGPGDPSATATLPGRRRGLPSQSP
jgi:membrane peptidoglycan carboxypeptidase